MRRSLAALALVITALPLAAQRDRAALTRRLDSLSRAWLAIGPSAGASIAVVRASDTLLLEGLGERDHERALPATSATVYRIGSITKQFTSAAIMQLVEQGKIGLGDPLTKYLPEYPQWRSVTVRQLLNHTSGIHSYTANRDWATTWGEDLTPARLVAFVAKDTFDFAPGTQYRYNNTGYVLLGMLLDRVTGTPYPALMRDHFFVPLGMRSAAYCPSNPTRTDDARGYDRGATEIKPAKFMSMTHPYSAGALCMSVMDYLRWQSALTSGHVVTTASYTMMSTSDTLAGGKPVNYGFGLAPGLLGAHRVVQHSGGVNGFNTSQMWFPDDSLRVVVFSNTVGSNPDRLARTLASAVLGVSEPAPPVANAVATPLELTVLARLDSLPAQSSFYAKQLSTGQEVAIRADVPMNTASVIKILAFRDAEAGKLNLDERHTIRAEEQRRGSGLLQTFTVGLQPTYRDIITQMIITSDNTATDIMIGKVGLDRENRMLDSLGYRDTRLRMSVGETFRQVFVAADPKNASLADREIFERGFPSDSGAGRRNTAFVVDSTKWLGRTTAREISRLLEQLERGQLASPASTTAMRRILRQQLYASRLPQRISFRVGIGHKTGDWPPLLGNDVGIMYPPAPAGPIVLAVFTNGNTGPFYQLEAAEGRVAEDILNAWGTQK
jgi:CubicO group peptidase (beta-lactamase class C family)